MALNEPESAASRDPARDPVLDRAYAALPREEPPARLDDSIRAAARREVRAGPRLIGAALRRWRVPVSIAAVIVLSVTVVLLMREEGADRLQTVPPTAKPVPEVAQKTTAEQPSQAAQSTSTEPTKEEAAVARLRDAPKATAAVTGEAGQNRKAESASNAVAGAPRPAEPARPAPEPFAERRADFEPRSAPPAPAQSQAGNLAKEADSGAAAGSGVLGRAQSTPAETVPAAPVGGAAMRSRPSPAAPAAKLAPRDAEHRGDDARAGAARTVWSGFERQPPEKWLERIEELRRTGRAPDADEMLAEFKKRFPAYPVPPAAGQ